jgi:minor extracellular serine protease Vpr
MTRPNPIASRLARVGLAVVFAFSSVPAGYTQNPPASLASSPQALALDAPVENNSRVLSPNLVGATGRRQVVVRLRADPAASAPQGAQQIAQSAAAASQQDRVLGRILALDPSATVLARLKVALNALVLDVDAAQLGAIARDIEISHIGGVVNYQMVTQPPMETVPYIGATPLVQTATDGGRHVKVAVLDSGIDYTHAAFGGPGTLAAYEAAYGTSTSDPRNTTLDGLFPTSRVKGGYDFVGERWPSGPLAPDPDPIDFGGHGTHVADIIGGEQGVAPNVDLYAVKVCSAVSTSCSGVAILEGIEWAADPNGDGDTTDHMNVVNLSLGAAYGQNYDSDDAIAIDNLTPNGLLFVIAAGNEADRPYIVGGPSAARTALSVAQTTVPSDKAYPVTADGVTVYGIAQPWAPSPSGVVSGPLQYGDGANGNRLGCAAFAAGSLAGKVLLVDRGTCAISIKASNGAAAGALVVLVANNVAGTVPPSFSFGGGTPTVPALSITQAAGNQLKPKVTLTATLDAGAVSSIVASVVGTSSRGPAVGNMFYGNSVQYGQIIKPEIGAPGASISAVVGSGTGVEAFGGTSGATPMVSGAAALLISATNWQLSPFELKSRLMNTGERNIFNTPAVFGGQLAPITRIGGGEVRIDRAIAAQAAAWESVSRGGALSFGMVDARTNPTTLSRTVVIRNYGGQALAYTISPTFRFANDAATGAVTPTAPVSITVPARSSKSFKVSLAIDPTKLPTWVLNSGSAGGNGDTLTGVEFDGYLLLDADGTSNDLALPWHVLPRAAGSLTAPTSVTASGGSATAALQNNGAAPADVDAFSLIGTNPFVTASGPAGTGQIAYDPHYVGVRSFSNACGSGNPAIQLAVNTYQRATHANYPLELDAGLDVNGDGVEDFIVYTAELTGFGASGQSAVWVYNVSAGTSSASFYTGHQTNSADWVLTFCGSQIGSPSPGQKIQVSVRAYDNYFTGNLLSYLDGLSFLVGGPRFSAPNVVVPAGAAASLPITATAANGTSETGVLLLLNSGSTGAPEGNEARAIKVK